VSPRCGAIQSGSIFTGTPWNGFSSIPGVQYAAFAWGVPLTGNNWPATLEIEGQPPAIKESEKTALPLRAVTEDYFKLMGVGMLGGREFRSSDEGKTLNVAIVNQAFAERYFPHGNAIGRKNLAERARQASYGNRGRGLEWPNR